jgi:hypothetical protein
MHEGAKQAMTEPTKQAELVKIQSDWFSINERTQKLIDEINDSLMKIMPYHEPKAGSSNPAISDQGTGIVSSFKEQLRVAQVNLEKLVNITNHLNRLI